MLISYHTGLYQSLISLPCGSTAFDASFKGLGWPEHCREGPPPCKESWKREARNARTAFPCYSVAGIPFFVQSELTGLTQQTGKVCFSPESASVPEW